MWRNVAEGIPIGIMKPDSIKIDFQFDLKFEIKIDLKIELMIKNSTLLL